MRVTKVAVATIALALSLSACAEQGNGGSDGADTGPIKVGVLTSLSGPLSSFGKTWVPAFKAGLDYATEGTLEVDGRAIDLQEEDDQSDPAAAVSGATKLVGDGVSVIAGTMSSGSVASLADFAKSNDVLYMTGSANTDAATGANDLTFRGSRQSYQDVQALSAMLGDDGKGKTVCLLAHNTEYGNRLVSVAQEVMKDQVGSFKTVPVPFPTTDVAPYVLQVKESGCAVLIPFLAGSVADFWQAFAQQNIAKDMLIVANIGTKSDWPAYAAAQTDNVRLFASYFEGATDNKAAKAMTDALAKSGDSVDYASADGFGAAIALVDAIKKADSSDPNAIAKALAGLTYEGPRGTTTIRAEDHALIAPMFQFHFKAQTPVLDREIPADQLQPPVS